MRLQSVLLGVLATLLTIAVSPVAAYRGGHSHVRFGFYVGAPLWYGAWDPPYYYPPYPYYYTRVVVTPPPPPPSDVEPEVGGGPTQQPYYRNYCSNPAGYYPKVRTCPEGWQIR